MTGTGVIIVMATWLLDFFGIVGVDVASTVNMVMQLVGVALTIWGQLSRIDLKMGLFRK